MSEWRPVRPTAEGDLLPCGANPDGSHLEVFAHPKTAEEILAMREITLREGNLAGRRYRVTLSATPIYSNGDVQLVLKAA